MNGGPSEQPAGPRVEVWPSEGAESGGGLDGHEEPAVECGGVAFESWGEALWESAGGGAGLLAELAGGVEDPAAAALWLEQLDQPEERAWLRSWVEDPVAASGVLEEVATWERLARLRGRAPIVQTRFRVDAVDRFDAWAEGARARWEITPDWRPRVVVTAAVLRAWLTSHEGTSTALWVCQALRLEDEPLGERSRRRVEVEEPESVGAADSWPALLGQAREAVAVARTGDEIATDRARSLAERVLFEALERHRATAGRFRLNDTVGLFWHTGRPLEIDLADPQAKVAIEVDGHWHFQDLDAWRRDRRKDLILQQGGWWVLRHLAIDVVDDPERVVAAIVRALGQRHEQA